MGRGVNLPLSDVDQENTTSGVSFSAFGARAEFPRRGARAVEQTPLRRAANLCRVALELT